MRMDFLRAAWAMTLVGAVGAFPTIAMADEATTVGGKMYADVTSYDLSNDGNDSAANGTGIDVKRFYLGVTHNFDDIWSVNVTSDFNYVANDGETQIYVKKAYAQAKLSDAFIARVGSADLPWVPFVEDLYGYRFVENVIIDRLKFGTSADWGLHAGGKAAEGRFNYAASVINGAGYKNPTRSNSVDFEARLGFAPVKGLTLAVGGYSGKLGKDVEGSATAPQHTAERVDALAAYVNGPLRVGAEYFQASDWNQVTTIASDKADGFSVWGSYNFSATWGAFARADSAKTSKDLSADLKDEYFNVGLVTRPRKNIDIALVYKHEKVDGGGTVSTSNGTIGGLNEGKYSEVGVWAQVAF
ncbi:MAG: porin [Pseudomonadota bacterium]